MDVSTQAPNSTNPPNFGIRMRFSLLQATRFAQAGLGVGARPLALKPRRSGADISQWLQFRRSREFGIMYRFLRVSVWKRNKQRLPRLLLRALSAVNAPAVAVQHLSMHLCR